MVPQTGLKGTGVLVALAGPAGAGKSTLIAAARRAYAGHQAVVFPARLATRLAGVTSGCAEISTADFEAMEAAGAFAFSWRADERSYGVPTEIDTDLAAGRIAVVSVSRQIVARLRRRHSRVHVVYVTAARQRLIERLTAKTGTGPDYVRGRLARADAFALPEPPMTLIDNSGNLSEAVDEFLGVIDSYIPAALRPVR